ncbi:hypothetical protein [Ralstonia mannitolilytica]|uniref:hypothetical protein n=1 Tax=Ralstonia mannitolilytica TaxID=105219 RepID=UPI00292DDBBC|nr:hypothetical protein [Ralstonia mannitolilytica]
MLAVLRDDLFSPAGEAEIERTVRALLEERRREGSRALAAAQSRISELDSEISRLVDAIATVGVSEALASRLRAAEAERAKLAVINLATSEPPINSVNIRQHIKSIMMHLERALTKDVDRARAILADLFGDIKIVHECTESEVAFSVVFQHLPDRVILAAAQAVNASNYRCGPPQPAKVERLAPRPEPIQQSPQLSGLFAFLRVARRATQWILRPPAARADGCCVGDTLKHSTRDDSP